MLWPNRSVILLGHGVRAAGAQGLVPELAKIGVPILTSWQAADLIDSDHPMFFGRPGVYGQRTANKVLYHADQVVAIGCRCSIWTIGHAGFRPSQQVFLADIDGDEALKFTGASWIPKDAKAFIAELLEERKPRCEEWVEQCNRWREPWLDAKHVDRDGFLNAYRVCHEIQKLLRPDEVIVTDMGVALAGAHQVMKLKPPQRLMTSGGLGEMGVALPAAVGAAIAGAKHITCLHCDGGMMMNLQELQTIVHHNLPIKIIVFSNDGYLMLKSTQKNLGYEYCGVDHKTGVSTPAHHKIAEAFGIRSSYVRHADSLMRALESVYWHHGPQLLEIATDPEQQFTPKLQPIMDNGAIRSPRFDELT